ncbi:hypothetical protein FB451DRAFT_1285598 [Mycena latifolia]|nr:hypothetical protein FB451DRAFT_1285598 [Mycena latifolia]
MQDTTPVTRIRYQTVEASRFPAIRGGTGGPGGPGGKRGGPGGQGEGPSVPLSFVAQATHDIIGGTGGAGGESNEQPGTGGAGERPNLQEPLLSPNSPAPWTLTVPDFCDFYGLPEIKKALGKHQIRQVAVLCHIRPEILMGKAIGLTEVEVVTLKVALMDLAERNWKLPTTEGAAADIPSRTSSIRFFLF